MVLAGANASAEEADEGTDEASTSGVDIVLNHQLVETGFGSKKDFTVYLKDYMKKVVKYLEDNNRSGEVDDFKKNINGVMKDLLGSFKDLQFFTGESFNGCYSDLQGDPIRMAKTSRCLCSYSSGSWWATTVATY